MIRNLVRVVGAVALLTAPGGVVAQSDSASQQAVAATWVPARTSTVAPLRRTMALDLERVTVTEALRAIGRRGGVQIAYGDDVTHAPARVTLHAGDLTVREALIAALEGTGLEAFVSLTGHTVLVRRAIPDDVGGTVVGRVTDSRTGQAVAGARVVVTAAGLTAVTNDSGVFRITDVPAGSYTLSVRRIGYLPLSRSVTVVAGQETSVDVRLEVSVTPLDAVVVTGTISPAQQKSLSSPISVVTAKDIEDKGITKINDLFRGEIPGIFSADWGDAGAYIGAATYVRGTSELFDIPVLKTYIDGVEIANSEFLDEIDPTMIDHVEIIRGPQASTLYGAEAINGVMQVFTKRGVFGSKPRVTATLGAGRMESQYGSGPRDEGNVTVSGGTADVSYNIGTTYQHDGAWTPGYYRNVYSAYGGLSLQPAASPFRVDLTARVSQLNARTGTGTALPLAMLSGQLKLDPNALIPRHAISQLPTQTLGVSVRYAARPTWQHTLTLGLDRGANGNNSMLPAGFTSPSDTFTIVFSTQTSRSTAAYNSSLDFHAGPNVSGNFIVGADHWFYQLDEFDDYGATATTGSLGTSNYIALVRQRDHNTGVFSQVRLGWRDALFLTAGARADYGPDLPADKHHRSINPRVGLSYAIGSGSLRGKLRAGYGGALKPAEPGFKVAASFSPTYIQLANPDLLPERQTGWDGGFELYAGDRASLSVTRYDQVARDLIAITFPAVDPVFEQKFVNVARVHNFGWEIEGSVRLLAAIRAKVTYAETESVIQQLAPNDQTGYSVGQDLPGVPHHTHALTLTRSAGRLTLEAAETYIGTSRNYDPVATYRAARPRLGTPIINSSYVTLPAAYRLALRGAFDLTDHLTLWARSDNVTNKVVQEIGAFPVDQVGRITTVGVRIR